MFNSILTFVACTLTFLLKLIDPTQSTPYCTIVLPSVNLIQEHQLVCSL